MASLLENYVFMAFRLSLKVITPFALQNNALHSYALQWQSPTAVYAK